MENQKLSSLISSDIRATADTSNAVKLTDEVLLQQDIAAIATQRAAQESSYVDTLKKGLEKENEYLEKAESGDLSFVGLGQVEEPVVEIDNRADESVLAETVDQYSLSPESEGGDEVPKIDFSEFVPEYDEGAVDENSEEKVVPTNVRMYANLPLQKIEHDESLDSEKFIVKNDAPKIEMLKKEKETVMSDKSFLTALNKVKKNMFSTTTLPLINSGFFVEVQGGGIIDILQLYKDKLADTSSMEYDLERMKTMVKSVRSTSPTVGQEQLISAIHESDYQLLALAYASATLKNFTLPHTCTECSADFKIEMPPMDTIRNIDAINEKVHMLRGASSHLDQTLLNNEIKVSSNDGLIVTLGHPSFLDYLKRMSSLRAVIESDKNEGYKFANHLKTIAMIRQIELPNGVKTANAYQIYKAMSLFNEELFTLIDDKILEMQKELIVPEFGIKSVICPVCGKVNENISIGTIDDLVFFHIMVTQV